MPHDVLITGFAVLTMAAALARGPVVLACRAVLRGVAGRRAIRRGTRPVAIGLAVGLLAAPAAAGLLWGGEAALLTALFGILFLCAVMDVAWRWLPMEWTLAALFLGTVAAFERGGFSEALAGALVGGGCLLALRYAYLRARGIEAIGLGDVWLAAGLGVFLGPTTICWLLCAAAVAGILTETLRRALPAAQRRTRIGVAFGAHMAALAPIFLTI